MRKRAWGEVLRPAVAVESIPMKSHVGRPGHRWLVAALLLAGGGWLAPSTAWAGCSHYVTTAMDAQAELAALDRLDSVWALSDQSRLGEPRNESPTAPCAGLRCSRNSTPPMTVPQAVPRIDAWGYFDLSAFALQTDSSPFLFEDDRPPSSDRAERLARPPR